MNKFTPGPWRFLNGKNIVGPKNQIAKVWMFNDGEGTANARLIASAPDMYEALSDLVWFAERAMLLANCNGAEYDIDERLADSRAALDKAEGNV